MYRFLIVDDTQMDASVLRRSLERYADANRLDISIEWYRSAEELLVSHARFDLVFLDIAMLGTDGMDAALLMRAFDPETPIIFVTNLAQYAIRGYEVDALDYILKPLSYQDFSHHMARIVRILESRERRSLTVSASEGVHVIPYADLEYASITGHTISYRLVGGETVRASGSLAKLEEQLGDGPFVRVSNKELVNMDHIRGLAGNDVIMASGARVTFSRPRKAKALERIAGYLGGGLR